MYNFEYMNKVEELLHKVDDANKEKSRNWLSSSPTTSRNNHIIHAPAQVIRMIGIEPVLPCRRTGQRQTLFWIRMH